MVSAFVSARYVEMRSGIFSQTLPYEGAAALLLLLAGYLVVFLPVKGEILYPVLIFLGVAAITTCIEFGFTLQDRARVL